MEPWQTKSTSVSQGPTSTTPAPTETIADGMAGTRHLVVDDHVWLLGGVVLGHLRPGEEGQLLSSRDLLAGATLRLVFQLCGLQPVFGDDSRGV